MKGAHFLGKAHARCRLILNMPPYMLLQINLQFDPVVFEDAAYGVRVHRGVYEVRAYCVQEK